MCREMSGLSREVGEVTYEVGWDEPRGGQSE